MSGTLRVRVATIAALMLTVAAVVAAASSSGAATPSTAPSERVVFFAADGMRPDLMETYAGAGIMPTYAA